MLLEKVQPLSLKALVTLSILSGPFGAWSYPRRFGELRKFLGVSDPGLWKALRELERDGVIHRDGQGRYVLADESQAVLAESLRHHVSQFLNRLAHSLAKHVADSPTVVGVILYGSAARGGAGYDSDIDLLVVTSRWSEALESRILKTCRDWSLESGIHIDAVILSEEGFRGLVLNELQLLFGILEGYSVLLDRKKVEDRLEQKLASLQRRCEYFPEVPIWLPRTK